MWSSRCNNAAPGHKHCGTTFAYLHATQARPRLLHLGPWHTQISPQPVLLLQWLLLLLLERLLLLQRLWL